MQVQAFTTMSGVIRSLICPHKTFHFLPSNQTPEQYIFIISILMKIKIEDPFFKTSCYQLFVRLLKFSHMKKELL